MLLLVCMRAVFGSGSDPGLIERTCPFVGCNGSVSTTRAVSDIRITGFGCEVCTTATIIFPLHSMEF